MIAVVVLDGYSASSRKIKMHDLVFEWLHDLRELTGQERIEKIGTRSTILRPKKRRIVRWIQRHAGRGNILICVGKSYGATNLLRDILARQEVFAAMMEYDAVGLLTVDPNFPLLFDWRPNLNDFEFKLPRGIDLAINIYIKKCNPEVQAGAPVEHASNIAIKGYSHSTVVHAPVIREKFEKMLRSLMRARREV